MLRPLALLLCMLLSAHAHSGKETDVTLHLAKERLLLVTRCTPELAWQLLGPEAPGGDLDTAFQAALPELTALAREMMSLQEGEHLLEPLRVRVILEPDRHVAFALTYPRKGEPAQLRLPYLEKVQELEPAKLQFFDQTAFERAAQPYATLEILHAQQAAEFTQHSAQVIDP